MYLCKVQVILLHIHEMVPDQKLNCLYVVFILIATFNQTPINMIRHAKQNYYKYPIYGATMGRTFDLFSISLKSKCSDSQYITVNTIQIIESEGILRQQCRINKDLESDVF